MVPTPVRRASTRKSGFLLVPATAALFVGLALLLMSSSMTKTLNHDEHMYVGAGIMLGREGALPYRDYPYFQMPALAFVYAPLFIFSEHPLLTARVFSTLCSLAVLALLFRAAYVRLRSLHVSLRWLAGAGAVAFVHANPVFRYTSGLAWNHDFALLCAFAGFIICLHGMSTPGSQRLAFFTTGALVTLAVATRLTYAPLLLPLAVALVLGARPLELRARVSSLAVFGAGVLVIAVPVLVLFVQSPNRFIFDNLGYHALNVQYWEAQGYTRAMDASGKLTYALDVFKEPGTLLLVVTCLLFAAWSFLLRAAHWPDLALILSAIAALCVGVLIPTPTWYQYFFPLLPLLSLGAVYALASVLESTGTHSIAAPWLVTSAVAFALAVPSLPDFGGLFSPDKWVPNRVGAASREIRAYTGRGRVLTLAPLYALESGLPIYEPMVSSPFAWRSAPFLPPGDRQMLDMVAPADLDSLLSADPPAAILTDYEPALEQSLIAYAQQHNYTDKTLQDGAILWLAP